MNILYFILKNRLTEHIGDSLNKNESVEPETKTLSKKKNESEQTKKSTIHEVDDALSIVKS